MTYYRHTQIGTMILLVMIVIIVLTIMVIVRTAPNPVVVAVLGVLLLVSAMFASLTVTVTTEAVRIRFGPGPIGKSFPLAEIHSARAVRNHWVYGWGIRLTPHGWLFNVSGLDAVELTMSDGKRYRVGTDQPRELLTAIQQAGSIPTE
jgi:hypothetical protein